jgi:ankyrin repeat protein
MQIPVRKPSYRIVALALSSAAILILAPLSPVDDLADLSLAIRQGNLAAVRALVEKNPVLTKTADGSGFTPLHIAATAGFVDIVTSLLDRGADIEARTAEGQTPLFQTVPLVAQKAFVYLLKKGANFNARDNAGRTILQFALFGRRPAMVDLILGRGFPVDVQGAAAEEMLDETASTGIKSLITALVSKGVSLHVGPRNGTTLLHSAARGGLAGFTELLLKRGARVDERDRHELTPLHLAALNGRDDVVLILIAAGANIEARGYDGRSAWHLAESGGHASTVALLAAKGAEAGPAVLPPLGGAYLDHPEPGSEPRVLPPGIISSDEHETNITFAPDGRELCFSRINADQTRRRLFFMRLENGRWTYPEPAPFQSTGADYEAAYSPEGRKLFFASNRPLQKDGPVRSDMDIWVVERAGNAWSDARNLGAAVNGASNEYMPTVDREGNLYFERFGLNVARWKDGDYVPAEKISIPNVANPGHPFIAPDGRYLLFDARGRGSDKSLLFASFRLKNGGWSPAVRLFENSDARKYENCPTVSPDRKFLFFGCDDDIYWVSTAVIENLRPENL